MVLDIFEPVQKRIDLSILSWEPSPLLAPGLVLSNCKMDAVSLHPTYRKPFDLIFKRVQSKEWLPGLDSN